MLPEGLSALLRRRRRPRLSRPSAWRPGSALLIFLAVPLLVLAAVAGGTVLLSERIARQNALAQVENSSVRMAEFLIQPLLAEALAGVPGRWEELGRVVSNRLRDGSISSVVIWRADGEVLWASDAALIGQRFGNNEELDKALAGQVFSDIDEGPETAPQKDSTATELEVYVPTTIRGETFAIEAYYMYEGVEDQAALLRDEITPLAIGALVVLQLVQIPIAASLAGRLRRRESERSALVERSLPASEFERGGIAADIHDGPVQDLAGVGYALAGLRDSVSATRQPTLDRVTVAVRHAVGSLRRLMIDIYPPDLSGPGLFAALDDLAQPLRDQGVEVEVSDGDPPAVTPTAAAVLYRTAKESLANVAHHAEAKRVWLCLEETDGDAGPAVRLEVCDDGKGFPDPSDVRTPEGHLGLKLLCDRVMQLGGRVTFDNRPRGGARLQVVVPVSGEE